MDYKAQITLNEKDSLQDLLNAEKQLAKVYCTALTEGTSRGFRTTIKNLLECSLQNQINAFFLMTEQNYYRVCSAKEEQINEIREKFEPVLSQLN